MLFLSWNTVRINYFNKIVINGDKEMTVEESTNILKARYGRLFLKGKYLYTCTGTC